MWASRATNARSDFPRISGKASQKAKVFIISQIELGYPIPCLVLKHSAPVMKDFVWHRFLITGYEDIEDKTRIKIISYGESMWLGLDTLWNTGYPRKGGLIKFTLTEQREKEM